jgi:prepilin-type processing-associated H-X9-DG protein
VEIGIGCIFLVLLLLVLSPSCTLRTTPQRTSYALSNIKQIDLGVMMFENDFNDSTPEMSNIGVFQGMVMPYVKNSSLFYDPETQEAFIPNPKLSHVNMSKLKLPETLVTLYDADVKDGLRIVAFADGHARNIPEADFEKDIAIDPHAPQDLGLYEGTWRTPLGKIRFDMTGGATLQSLVGKDKNGKATLDDKGKISITFGTSAPSIVGMVTWLSINDVEVQQTGSKVVHMTRLP